MQYILHRVNQSNDLKNVNTAWGVEIDLRSDVANPSTLHLSHDPWVRGEKFTAWLEVFKSRGIQGPILLNTKEDGLETEIFKLLRKFEIENFLFIDTSFPTLVRWVREGNAKHFAPRFSAYEPIETFENLKGKVDWVWVDSFGGEPVPLEAVSRLKKDFKLCLVSPELHQKDISAIENFKPLVPYMSALCTKFPLAWAKLL